MNIRDYEQRVKARSCHHCLRSIDSSIFLGLHAVKGTGNGASTLRVLNFLLPIVTYKLH